MSQNRSTQQSKRYADRRRAVFNAARKMEGVHAVLISNPSDVRYLSGLVEGSEHLLVGRGWATLYIHKMFRDVAPIQCPGLDIEIFEANPYVALGRALKKRNVGQLGIQEEVMTLSAHRMLKAETRGIKLDRLPYFVDTVRAVKDEEEIRLAKRAIRIAEKAFRGLIAGGAGAFIGKTEGQIALELEVRMRELGAIGQAFKGGIIVGAGPNSASLHHTPTNRRIKEGDVVLIDWGAEIESGYRSDQTRTLFMRRVPPRLEAIYPIVQEAYRQGLNATCTGRTGATLHQTATQYLNREGYEFIHGLGHGIGLDTHETPILSRYTRRLRHNMLITIEPGVYLPGYGGIRLENMVQVYNGGAKVLNKLPMGINQAVLA